jgi:hypothetical protein
MALPSPIQNLSEQARWLYPLSVVVAAAVLGHFFGLGLGLLIVAGGTLGGSIWLIWSSLQGLGGDAPITLEEAISLGAPSAEEEQKRAVLRALKDLEYERAVGKIGDEDYASLAEHYRTEAKRLLRVVDKDLGPERERAERILAERLAEVGTNRKEGARAKKRARTASVPGEDDAERGSETAAADTANEKDEGEPAQATKSPSSDVAP